MTLPPQVQIKQSIIPNAGLGAFATTFIPKYTWLAEYEGEIVIYEDEISPYAWSVSINLLINNDCRFDNDVCNNCF